jgi:hypothetical protein
MLRRQPHFALAGTYLEGVEVVDAEVVGVGDVDSGPVESFDDHDAAVGGEAPVTHVEILAFLPLSSVVSALVILSRDHFAVRQPECEELDGVRHRGHDSAGFALAGIEVVASTSSPISTSEMALCSPLANWF